MKLFSIIALSTFTGLSPTTIAQTKRDTFLSNKPFVNWAKAHAASIQETDKAVGYNDLLPFKRMIGNARVVALGEPAHGLHETVAFRNRLFKYLVEECGFTTIVLEAGFAESEAATNFVATGKGSPQVAAQSLTMWKPAAENAELIKWMRDYNTDPSHKIKLQFYGMDVQLIGYPGDTTARHAAIDRILKYLGKVDTISSVKLTDRLRPYLSRLSLSQYPLLSPDDHDKMSAIVDDMLALITRERINYIHKSSIDEYKWVLRVATAAQQTDRLARVYPHDPPETIPPSAWIAFNTRDAAMADNVLWIANNQAKNGKVLVYAHNAHVQNAHLTGNIYDVFEKPSNPMGQYLRSQLGSDLSIIGMSVNSLKEKAQLGSIDLALLDVGKPRYMVDLKAATAANKQINAWLSTPRAIEANIHFFLNLPVNTAFDAMVFIGK